MISSVSLSGGMMSGGGEADVVHVSFEQKCSHHPPLCLMVSTEWGSTNPIPHKSAHTHTHTHTHMHIIHSRSDPELHLAAAGLNRITVGEL